MPASVRNPRYWLPIFVLVAVIVVSTAFALVEDGNDATLVTNPPASAIETPAAAAASPTPAPAPDLYQVWYDARRALELGKLHDALIAYKTRFGAYPSTGGAAQTICAKPSDAGCALSNVATDLSYTDGEFPYWYASDGATYYKLISKAEIAGDTGQCPDDLPAELAGGPVICLDGTGD